MITVYQYENFVADMLKPMPKREQLVHCALGLVGEAGEVAELVKKEFAYGKKYDDNEMDNELGDVLFYLVAMAQQNGIWLHEIMEKNVAKLQQRYPKGYNDAAAIARVDVRGV